jgi:hypothetical protein
MIAYPKVVADQALVEARLASVTFLRQTLDSTRKSLEAGKVTPTDLAQAIPTQPAAYRTSMLPKLGLRATARPTCK